MILDLLGHKDYLRILIALEAAPQRFTEIQKSLDLNPAQVDRALAFLRKGLWVVPKTLPAESGPLRVEYRLGNAARRSSPRSSASAPTSRCRSASWAGPKSKSCRVSRARRLSREMAVVFLLGPGMWAADDAARPEPPPMATRRRLAAILAAAGIGRS